MLIAGIQKLTLLDYPGHIACTIFLGNCNLRCPFCHNMEIVLNPKGFPNMDISFILSFLKERKGKLDGVAITGGEPLLNRDIEDLLRPIKELGFPVKLDTNGFFPEMIEKLINEKLVNKFAMDIKAGFSNYLKVSGVLNMQNDLSWKNKINKSIDILMNKAEDYEFRTTSVKGLHTEQDFHEIKDMIKGSKEYFLQNYKATNEMKNLPYEPFTKDELESFANIVKETVKNVNIRGVE